MTCRTSMKIKPACILCVAVTATFLTSRGAFAQATFAGVATSIYDSNSIAPGHIFLASNGSNAAPFFLQIMRNDGSVQASKKAGYITPGDAYYPHDFKQLANGLLLNAQYTGWFTYAEGGTAVDQLLDENLNILESIQMGNGYQAAGQDFELLPNGHVLLLGYYTTVADIRAVNPGAAPRAEISGPIIQELDGDRNVVWQWRAWDHFN